MVKKKFSSKPYPYGFTTDIPAEKFPKGIDQNIIRKISKKKNEPKFILDFRLKAFSLWKKMQPPNWGNFSCPEIDFQNISYYSEPKEKKKYQSLEEVDPKILETLDRLGVPLEEKKAILNVAVDVVFDSVSIGTSFQKKLKEVGVVLCPISEAIQKYPYLIKKYLGSVVPMEDNFYAALNSAVFSDGSFVYIPKGVKCPMELSTYFRINERNIGQFERTLIIAEEYSSVSYLEGCTAPAYDENQLHAAVVELIALDHAEIKYSTVQNWYAGDPETGKGGIFNFVTKRGLCLGEFSKISWLQVEVGAAMTWKYPSCILQGDNSSGQFYSIALTNGHMQADTGTKMIHIGKNTKSMILSKGISADFSKNTYRGLVSIEKGAKGARNFSQCDSLIVGKTASSHTFPQIKSKNKNSQIEQEASTSKMNEEQLFYLQSRGFSKEEAIQLVLDGFCREIIRKLPMEFAAEAQKLLMLKLESSIG